MLLTSLQQYAERKDLLGDLPLQRRIVHALIPISLEGQLVYDYLLPLTAPDKEGKEKPGRELLFPRFPGENNGGKAYFLADNSTAVLGRNRRTGEAIPADPKKGKNNTKAFLHFWAQISEAHQATGDLRLRALLEFQKQYLPESNELVTCSAPFLELQRNRSGTEELVGRTGAGDKDILKLASATIGFQVDGVPLSMADPNDNLREYWFNHYRRLVFADTDEEEEPITRQDGKNPICLVTGLTGLPFARSHKPKILGVPGLSSGGYIVSFARECPSFSSYGFEMGENSPVCERAAAQYCLAVNDLLAQDDTHINIGPISVCFWAKEAPNAGSCVQQLLNRAYPEQIAAFLKAPFAGDSGREVLHKARLHTVTLAGNAGRVVVQDWLDRPLIDAAKHLKQWWDDLAIVECYRRFQSRDAKGEPFSASFAIRNLARMLIRRSKKQKDDKLICQHLASLFRAALGGISLPIALLKPILDEFHSALVKDSAQERLYPFNQSRFALIKLILIRNQNQIKEDDFMPTYELADTVDPAYNCGRLLAVMAECQAKAHEYQMQGAGIAERYYGTASSAPATVFPLLLRLNRHHLDKVRKSKRFASHARFIEEAIQGVLAKFQSSSEFEPPEFPCLLDLQSQGRFALGFYQQKAADALAKTSKATDQDDKPNQEGETE